MGAEDWRSLNIEGALELLLPGFPLIINEKNRQAIDIASFSLLANSLKRKGPPVWNDDAKKKDWNLIMGESAWDDMRMNLIVVGEASSGKTSLLAGMEALNPYKAILRRSQPNYDQMIGSTEKWRDGGTWLYEPFPGELSSDLFLMDECLSVYIDEDIDSRRVRELLRSALSRIGTNRITKPQVRVPEAQQINYYPECTLVQGFLPRKVPLTLMADGDLRRSQIAMLAFPLEEKRKVKRFGRESPPDPDILIKKNQAEIQKAKDYLTYLRSHRYAFWVRPDTEVYVKECMKELETFVRPQGWKARRYFELSYFDTEARLTRCAVVVATTRDADAVVIEVTPDDAAKAMTYFARAFADSLLYINQFTVGTRTDYEGLSDKDFDRTTELCHWLESRNARDYNGTNTTANEVKDWLVKKGWYNRPEGSKHFYQGLLAQSIIRSRRRVDKNVVWIGPKGVDLLNDAMQKFEED